MREQVQKVLLWSYSGPPECLIIGRYELPSRQLHKALWQFQPGTPEVELPSAADDIWDWRSGGMLFTSGLPCCSLISFLFFLLVKKIIAL